MQKLAAPKKNNDNDKRTAFVLHMLDLFLKKVMNKWNTVTIVYDKSRTQ